MEYDQEGIGEVEIGGVHMLTSLDKQIMSNDIGNIIDDWSEYVQIWTPLPKEQQPNYNNLMREFVGEILYDKQLDVPAEEVRATDAKTELITNNAGDKHIERLVICVPIQYKYTDPDTDVTNLMDIDIDEHSLIVFNSDPDSRWRIERSRRRLGEYMLYLYKMIGGGQYDF